MSHGDDPRGYARVREALMAQGYLETPLERLFIGSGTSARHALFTSLLAGIIAGPLLGLLLAASLVLEGAGGVPAWPDGVLYALLFSPVLGLLVAAAEGMIALAVRLVARSRGDVALRRASFFSGLGVAAVLALYLGAWWAISSGAFGVRGGLTLLLLAVGAGVTGRIVSAAVLVQGALSLGRAPRLGRPRLGTWITAFAVAGTLAAALAVNLFPENRAGGIPVVIRDGAPDRVALVGWDGLGGDLAEGLLRRNSMPWLATLSASSTAASLRCPSSRDPASLWTTVATGAPPSIHGIDSAGLLGLPGAQAPAPRRGLAAGPLELLTHLLPTRPRAVRSSTRQVPAVWELTADAAKTAVIGWWATWPAASPGIEGGYLVSDGALVAALAGRGASEAIYPGEWGNTRAPGWLNSAHLRVDSLLGEPDPGESPFQAAARDALMSDLFNLAATEDAMADPSLRALFLYLPGLDILRERGAALGEDLYSVLEAAERHAHSVDAELARLFGDREQVKQFTLVMLPGREGKRGGGQILVKSSSDTTQPSPPREIALEDIAPSFLYAAGYSIDERMSGRVIPSLAGGAESTVRPRTRARVAAPEQSETDLEDEVLERLRSLGYVD